MFFERSRFRNVAILLVACATALTGCQQSVSTLPAEIVFPPELMAEGQTWVKQAWEEKHDKRVANVFKKHAYLAGNPTLEGERVVYADASGNERCYWVTPSEGGAQWLYIEFKGTRSGNPVEGFGAPFL